MKSFRKKYGVNLSRIKNYTFIFITLTFTIIFIFCGKVFIEYSLDALKVFSTTILPAVLPFSVVVGFMKSFVDENETAKKITPISQKIFGFNGYGLIALFFGIISGYPSGGSIALCYYENGKLDKNEAERVSFLSSVASPLLIITCIGKITYNSLKIGLIMFTAEILASVTVYGMFFGKNKTPSTHLSKNCDCFVKDDLNKIVFNTVLSLSISASLTSLFYLCSKSLDSISIYNEFCKNFNCFFGGENLVKGFIAGLIETTAGCNYFAIIKSPFSASLCMFTLTFGGLPIIIHHLYFAKKMEIKTAKLILFKALQSVFAFIITFVLIETLFL